MDFFLIATLVLKAMALVQDLFSDGAVKKSTVMGMAKGAVEGMVSLSTGGQKATWESIAPLVDTFVETTVSMAKAIKPEVIEDENAQISAG